MEERKKSKIKVTACIIAYNHEKFIKKCLDGAVSQNLNYEYQIVIGEDKSPDGTLKICEKYQEKYQNLIKLIKRPKNLGMMGNWLATLRECDGDYIALCEGDDYWTDTSKLQKQVDFLEKNPGYALCGTRTKRINEKGEIGENTGKQYGEIKLEDVLWQNQFGTCTVVLRKTCLELPPFKNYFDFFGADWQLWCSLLDKGPGYNLNDLTAIYHEHSAGASSGRNRNKILKNKLEDRILMMENFPEKMKIIKRYGLRIIFHYLWKSALMQRQYTLALFKNRVLILRFFKI
jgi:glycosyltransferase involved in cell wall biosynthesis